MNYSSTKGESFRLINYSRWVDEALLYFTDNFPSRIIATKSTLIDLSIHQVFLALPPCLTATRNLLRGNKTLLSLHQQMWNGDRSDLGKCVFSEDIEN